MGRSPKKANRLRHFMGDGVWASVCEGTAESNFNAYSTALLASPSQLSLLSSSQNLLGCWLQLWSEKLVCWFGTRKRLVLIFVGLQALTLALMIIAAFGQAPVWAFLGLSLLFMAFGSTSGAIWSAWVGDLLPPRRRGYCFGVRNRRTYPVSFVSLLLAGWLLQTIEKSGGHAGTRWAFCSVFALGLTAKLLSLRHLALQPEIPVKLPEQALGPLQLVRACGQDAPTRRTLAFFAVVSFSIFISGAFQTPYLLNTLGFSYFQFASATAVFVLARYFMAPWVGRAVDSIGSRKPLTISAALLPFIALGWAISRNYWMILATQVFAGLVWTVFEVSAFTFLVENTPVPQRQRIFAAKQVAWNLAAFAGALLGGMIAGLPAIGSLGPNFIFWVSFFARLGCLLFLLGLPEQLFAETADPEEAVTEAA